MDRKKLQLITTSVAYLQAHLDPTDEFIEALWEGGTITSGEVIKIKNEKSRCGRIVDLVSILKHKNSRAITQFVSISDQYGFKPVAQMFKADQKSASTTCDPRTLEYVDRMFGNVALKSDEKEKLAFGVVLKEIHEEELQFLRKEIFQLKEKLADRPSAIKITSDTKTSRKDSSSKTVAAKDAEILKLQKTISTLSTELEQYKELSQMKENELNLALDGHLQLISSLKGENESLSDGIRFMTTNVNELEGKLLHSESKIQAMSAQIERFDQELKESQEELSAVKKREDDIKRMFGLDSSVGGEDLLNHIKRKAEKTTEPEVIHDVQKVEREKEFLEKKIKVLVDSKNRAEFLCRQYELINKREKHRLNEEIKHGRKVRGPVKFCVLCRGGHSKRPETACIVHRQPYADGKWPCCKAASRDQPGCLHLPHIYLNLTADFKVRLEKWEEAKYWRIDS